MDIVRFKEFLINPEKILNEARIAGTGAKADRHREKYIHPYLPGKEKHAPGTHTLGIGSNNYKKGTKVTLRGIKKVGGIHHVTVQPTGASEKITVPVSHLNKPFTHISKAFSFERKLTDHLKKHDLMNKNAEPAGASNAAHDFVITHPKTHKKIGGVHKETINGETKDNIVGAKLGSVAIRYNKEHGWHIPQKTIEQKPHLVREIHKATVTDEKGRVRPLFQHLNKHWGVSRVGKHLPNVVTNKTNMNPAHAYMKDHGVHMIHIGDRGTFRAGLSHGSDTHNSGLPPLSGAGRFTVQTERKRTRAQQKAGVGMQVNFRAYPNTVPHSHINIGTDEGAETLKRNLSR